MTLTVKACLGGIGSLGIACSVGVPIAIYSKSESVSDRGYPGNPRITRDHNFSQAVGDESVKELSELLKCDSGSDIVGNILPFGANWGESFCGKINDLESNISNIEVRESLSKLFKEMWSTASQNGNSNTGKVWKVSCSNGEEGSKGGSLTQPNTGEYLGYCASNERQENPLGFIDISKNESQVSQIKFCLNDCGTDSSTEETIKSSTFITPKTENGKEVQFYKVNKK